MEIILNNEGNLVYKLLYLMRYIFRLGDWIKNKQLYYNNIKSASKFQTVYDAIKT